MRFALPLLLLLLAPACGRDPIIVQPARLAPGGGDAGDGGSATYSGPVLNIVVRMKADATGFNPWDLITLDVNGVNQVMEIDLGGYYGIYTIDPAPASNDPQQVFLSRRVSEPFDEFTYFTEPYTGPTIVDVDPSEAVIGNNVTISGTGFSEGSLRVYFGGIEASVVSSTDTTITATVPDGALPGLVWVLAGADAAEGIVDFQPLMSDMTPVAKPTGVAIMGHFPARGPTETAVRVYGYNYDNVGRPSFNGVLMLRVITPETIELPVTGAAIVAWAVPEEVTPVGDGDFFLSQSGAESNRMPFRIESVED